MAFQKGDMVKVINKQLKTYGRVGTVSFVSGFRDHPTIQVDFGDVTLTYKKRNVQKITSESEIQKHKGENNMLMGKYTVCKIRFIEGANIKNEYHYALYDNSVVTGDYVVVKSAHHGFGLAEVTAIIPDECVNQEMRDYCNVGREVISKFDMNAYRERSENRKRAKELKSEMDKKMKEMQELAMFEMMAEKNPELKAMLETYKELIN